MYCRHFNLQDKPFRLIPDPTFLHFSSMHRVAYSLLEYGIYEQTGITLITGEVGSGKTTLVRHLLSQLEGESLTIGLINNTSENFGRLLQWVSLAYNIDYQGKENVFLLQEIQEFLINQYALGKRTVLIVDEAQNLSPRSLEELRLLTNINSDKDFLLQIILVGQPELFDLLSKPNLSQLTQRITVEYHLNNLNWADTKAYINHRLQVAGATYSIFDDDAISLIFYHSGGIPRLINTLCDYALVHAYATDKTKVDLRTAIESTHGRRIGGINRNKRFQEKDAEDIRERVRRRTGLDIAEA